MSYFYGTTQGHRDQVTRCGSKASGLISTANSWSIGGEVSIDYNDTLKTDIVTFYITKGSDTTRKAIASFAIIDGKQTLFDTTYPEAFL